jgi:hypothetical protein
MFDSELESLRELLLTFQLGHPLEPRVDHVVHAQPGLIVYVVDRFAIGPSAAEHPCAYDHSATRVYLDHLSV